MPSLHLRRNFSEIHNNINAVGYIVIESVLNMKIERAYNVEEQKFYHYVMRDHFVSLADPSLHDENMQNGTMVIS